MGFGTCLPRPYGCRVFVSNKSNKLSALATTLADASPSSLLPTPVTPWRWFPRNWLVLMCSDACEVDNGKSQDADAVGDEEDDDDVEDEKSVGDDDSCNDDDDNDDDEDDVDDDGNDHGHGDGIGGNSDTFREGDD